MDQVALTMRLCTVGIVAALFGGCEDYSEVNPDYPPPIIPAPSVTVTEGSMTTFLVGLKGGQMDGVAGGFFQGTSLCPTDTKVSFTPCRFELSAPATYPVTVAVTAIADVDEQNEMVSVDAYLFGEIAEPGHVLPVYVVDTDAPNVIADNWNVTLTSPGAAELGVRLTQPPSGTVTVDLKLVSQNGSLQFTPSSLVFDATDYDVFQTVIVSGTLVESAEEVQLIPSTGMPWGFVRVAAPFNDSSI